MAPTTVDTSAPSMVEDFATLLDLSMGPDGGFEGAMLKGRVIRVLDDAILVDVGLKSEGRVPLKEFGAERSTIREGDTVELVVERYEDRDGAVVLSREKALRELRWQELEQLSAKSEKVTGIVTGRVKGGFTVDLGGVSAFLPGSQVDIRVGRDVMPPMGVAQLFLVTRMDRRRANVVVSRRAVLEESRAGQREEVLRGMREGAIFQGVVKNLTDYGAFVDLGGLDGLVHISDICWRRIGHPREVLTPGQSVTVVVTRYSAETGRISLGIKQLEADPWTGVVTRFPVGTRIRGVVSHVLEYGAFVTMEPGIEGLVHVSDMSWTKKQPQGILLTGQEVEVVVLDVDETKHRISLGLRQLQANPWQAFLDAHPVGTAVEGVVRDVVEFGLFVSMGDEIDGLVHMDNISWDAVGSEAISSYAKGDAVRAQVLEVDVEKERISLGIRQLTVDPSVAAFDGVAPGAVVTCEVTGVVVNGLDVLLENGLHGFIRRGDLARERDGQRLERFPVGTKLDAKVMTLDRPARRVLLSVRAKETDEDAQAVAAYGSTSAGASLGDILGAAIRRRQQP